ncbi:hypothetical protein COW46_02085 [Candidatus Gracilibacteria bacterium CG17_big_fil_post_rev_8_21_14_2_50_48_13]|nr:MAG: hypothetical protein COW46_02085 [Candidatus Gracilibacteria bacterium CG17_big_fil_post_rev_8_21_14_2_50_48_13]
MPLSHPEEQTSSLPESLPAEILDTNPAFLAYRKQHPELSREECLKQLLDDLILTSRAEYDHL